jgi:DNA replication and repair protein RecF
MELVRGGPGGRRDYLDHTLMMLDPVYVSDITDYGKCLTQKNSLLKQLQESRSEYLETELDLWNSKLSGLMHRIYLSRHALIEKMSGVTGGIYSDFFGGSEKVGITYQSQLEGLTQNDLSIKLSAGIAREIIVGHSLTGIHRDDMLLSLNDHEARVVASQGQQRIITIALKLAQIEILREKFDNNFILILDDVMAELDNMRQSVMYHIIPPGIQTFITTTHIDDIELLKSRLDHIDSYTLNNGILTQG